MSCRSPIRESKNVRQAGRGGPSVSKTWGVIGQQTSNLLAANDEYPMSLGFCWSALTSRIGLVHLEALSSCANAKPIIISNPTVSKAEVR